jgi:hypothetical protein
VKRIAVLLLLSFLSYGATPDRPKREISKTLSLNPTGRFTLDTYKGSIDIQTWEKNQVEVNVVIEPDDEFWNSSSDRDVDEVEIHISGGGDEVRVKSDYTKLERRRHSVIDWFGDNSFSLPLVHYTIKMPKTANLQVKDYKSKSEIAGLSSDIVLNTYKGSVRLNSIAGSVDLETYKGDVRVEFSKLKGATRFETYKGEIEISIPKTNGFSLETDFTSKTDFSSDFDVKERAHGRRSRERDYYGSINGGGPELKLKSGKGTFRLKESSGTR